MVEIAGRRPDILGGKRRIGGLVIELVGGDAVGRRQSRHPALRADRLVSHVDIARDLVQRLRDVVAVGVAIDHHAVTAAAAQQLVEGQVGGLGLQVPQRGVDGGDGRHRHRTATPVGATIEVLPGVLDPVGVAADQRRNHVLGQVGCHRELAAVERRVTETREPRIGFDLQRDEVASGTGDDDACGGDFHARVSRWKIGSRQGQGTDIWPGGWTT